MVKFVSQINANADEVYTWHQNFGANDRLTPPWMTSSLLRQEHNQDETLQYIKTNSGTQVVKTLVNAAKRSIISEKIKSSQQSMQHVKNFDKLDGKTLIKETISINWFKSIIPEFIITSIIEKKLEQEFNFRGRRIENDLKQHSMFKNYPRKNIAILGEDNQLANEFKPFFTSSNNKVFMFVKRKPYPTAREIQFNTQNSILGLDKLNDLNSVIFFPLSDKERLNDKNYDQVLKSKIDEIKLLAAGFAQNGKFPESFIIMSSTCVYEDSKATVTEAESKKGDSKIAQFYLTLEKELDSFRLGGTRVVYARTGNILSARTGILKSAIKSQKYAFCRQLVDDSKFINWVSLDDAIYATNQMIFNNNIFGEVNVCSSMSINANDFNLLLAQKTKRSFLFSIPEFIYKLFNSPIKQDLNFQNNTVYPKRLKQYGFEFSFENIDDALNWETGSINKSNYNKNYSDF
jgi:uncharacterized protein